MSDEANSLSSHTASVLELQAQTSQEGSSSRVSDDFTRIIRVGEGVCKKWLRKSEQGDKWNRCLIEGMIVLSETGARDEQTTPP